MRDQSLVAVMGGTFDPVHHGHLRTALELRELLALEQVRLMPCHRPVHRESPGASSAQRARMISLAIDREPGLVLDERELAADKPSYSVETLSDIRRELGDAQPIAWVMGGDAFNGLAHWHRWTELTSLAHIIVLQRPGWKSAESGLVFEHMQSRFTANAEELKRAPAGRVLPLALTPLGISSSTIRENIRRGRSNRYLLPEDVRQFVNDQKLYRR